MIEVVHVDDVRGGRAPFGKALGVADDVILDEDLRIGGNEDVEARLLGCEPQLERPPSDRVYELEEPVARPRGLRQKVGACPSSQEIGGYPQSLPPALGEFGFALDSRLEHRVR